MIPRNDSRFIGNRLCHHLVADIFRVAPQGIFRPDRADGYLIALQSRPVYLVVGRSQIKAIGLRGKRMRADPDFIRIRTAVRPCQDGPFDAEIARRRQSGLFIDILARGRRVVSLGLGIDVDDDAALDGREILKAELRFSADLIFDAVHGNDVARSIGDRIPVERFGRIVEAELLDCRKHSVVDKRPGYGRSVSLPFRGNRKADAAFLHRAVVEVIGRGRTEIDHRMIVSFISAIDGDIIAIRMFHSIEDQHRGLCDREQRNTRKRLVFIIDRGRIRIVARIGCDRRDADHVISRGSRSKVDGLRRTAGLLVNRLEAFRPRHFDSGFGRSGLAIPADGIAAYGNNGRGQFGTGLILRPISVERCAALKHHAFRIRIRKALRGILRFSFVHADPPAVERISVAHGIGGQLIEFSAYRLHAAERFGAVVIEIKVDRKFSLTDDILPPISIEGRICRHRLRAEQERFGISAVRIPPQKGVTGTHGIGGLFNRSAVHHGDRINFAAALRGERDGVSDLLIKAHFAAVISHH